MEYIMDRVAYAIYKLLSLVQAHTGSEIIASIAWLFFSRTESYETGAIEHACFEAREWEYPLRREIE